MKISRAGRVGSRKPDVQPVVQRTSGVHAAISAPGSVVVFESQRRVEPELQTTSTGLLQPDRRRALFEAPFEQDDPGVEVVAEARQLERLVEADLLVGEL